MPARSTLPRLIAVLALLLITAQAAIPLRISHAQSGPVFTIEAPSRIGVGEPFTIGLRVRGVADLGGFETTVLFDADAVEFQGFDPSENDLRRAFGRDAVSIAVVDVPYGAALALYSCPVADCVTPDGPARRPGAKGNVGLGTIGMVANEPGVIEIAFDPAKLVDVNGRPIAMESSRASVEVQVTPSRRSDHIPAPTAPWQLASAAPAEAAVTDLAPNGIVDHADVMEVALDWQALREKGDPCSGMAEGVDVNGDGCVDVGDLQAVASSYSAASEEEPHSDPVARSLAAAGIVLTVNSTGDDHDANKGDGVCATASGECTLRAAIQEANQHPGTPDMITFNIPGAGVHTIQLGSRLPAIWTGGVTIDGYTQPGASPNTHPQISNARILIEIRGNGTAAFDGLPITSSGNTIRGLAFYNLNRAIWIDGRSATHNEIVGNFIGTNAAGTFGYTNSTPHAHGIHIEHGASNNLIGNTSNDARNVIAGNGRHGVGIWHGGSNANLIRNNLVGLTPSADACLANLANGIDINYGARFNVVGGSGPGERNVVTGNQSIGLDISHSTAPTTTGNSLIGNFVGTGVDGRTMPAGCDNNERGVRFKDGVQGNTASGNVIGFSTDVGILIEDNYTSSNVITENYIGQAPDGTPIPNARGIEIQGSGNRIGPGNVIAHNDGVGIVLVDADGDFNTISRNSIFANRFLGINILPNGVNPNDPGDGDSGPNEQLNYPVIASATTTQVTGTACAGCTVEIFISDEDESGHGEGMHFIGSGSANASGEFAVEVSGATSGQYVTATATDAAGNTSEFSANVIVTGTPGAPEAPGNLTATPLSSYQVELQWDDNAENETYYLIERSLDQSEWDELIAKLPIDSQSYTDNDLVPGATYYYRVAAVNGAGKSDYSNVASATTEPIRLPGQLEVEDFKEGGEGVAYHDTTDGNAGGACRVSDVDLVTTTDVGGGCNLGFVAAGEWLAYDVDIATAGSYSITARVATVHSGRSFHIEIDGVNVTGPIQVPNTGGWQTWADVTVEDVTLPAGLHELRIVMDTSNFNLNYIQAVTAGPNEPPTAGFSYTCNGLTCNFTDTSEDSDGSIVAWSWDFGDGETATAQHPSHTFPAANTFTVTLTVTDDRGGVDSFRQTVVAEDTISVIAMPGRIEVEDYKAGGPGVGYHDTTPGNSGGGCRSDDVDLALTEDAGGGCNLGFVAAGEWLAYDVEIEETGVYALTARVATIYSGRHFHIELDGVDVSGPVAVPNTGGWQTWADVTTEGVNLTAGKYELRIVMDTANFNLNYIDWERT